MQEDCLWACEDMEKGSYLHDFSAWGGRWQEKTALTTVLQGEKEMSPWGQDICSMKGETEMGWGLWIDEMRNTNGRKTDSLYGSLEATFSFTSMSPKVLGYKETEIHIIRSLGWKKKWSIIKRSSHWLLNLQIFGVIK